MTLVEEAEEDYNVMVYLKKNVFLYGILNFFPSSLV